MCEEAAIHNGVQMRVKLTRAAVDFQAGDATSALPAHSLWRRNLPNPRRSRRSCLRGSGSSWGTVRVMNNGHCIRPTASAYFALRFAAMLRYRPGTIFGDSLSRLRANVRILCTSVAVFQRMLQAAQKGEIHLRLPAGP